MKKLLLTILLISPLFVLPSFAQNSMTIDSVVYRPLNPDANDAVYLHVYGFSAWGTSLTMAPTVSSSGNSHYAQFCYTVGMAAVVTYIHDSVFVFTGPSGVHTVAYNITQNASQATSCDQGVLQGATTITVAPIAGISAYQKPLETVSWNAATHSLTAGCAGKLEVYGISGQLVLSQVVTANQSIPMRAGLSGMYIAVLTSEDGTLMRIKFNCQ
jgi:hypothetical protein